LRDGLLFSYNKTTLSLCVHPQGQSRKIRICGATLLALLAFLLKAAKPLTESQHSPAL
jgi:hypothetical protein